MSGASLVRPESVILVSGGARGITARCVMRLAERAGGRYILLGRSKVDQPEPEYLRGIQGEPEMKRAIMAGLQAEGEKPAPQRVQRIYKDACATREIHHTLDAIRASGAQAEYLAADVTNRAELLEKLAEPVSRMGPISGVIHGAGTLADKRIEDKTLGDYQSVLSTKIDGLENLLAAVPVSQLEFLVLFSSIVGFYGNVGQADYAMANEILNKTAHYIKRKYPACQVVSIGWGPWDAGMVTPELKRAFEERHVTVIPAVVGADLLVRELAPDAPADAPVQVLVGSSPPRPGDGAGGELRQYQIKRQLSLDANPFLNDHRIGANAVLPATCAATWVASVCEQLYPAHVFHTIERYKVLKGIVFDDKLAPEYTLDLKETAKSAEGAITFDALIWSTDASGRARYHYSLTAALVSQPPEPPALPRISANVAPDEQPILGEQLYRDGTLFHGPAFQGVERVLHLSPGRLTMQCVLPKVDERAQGQFPVQTGNPFIYDAIVQSLLIWAQRHYQAPCLPSYMERLEQYRAIPFGEPVLVSLEITVSSATSVTGDLVVQDSAGVTLARINGLVGTISQHLKEVLRDGRPETEDRGA